MGLRGHVHSITGRLAAFLDLRIVVDDSVVRSVGSPIARAHTALLFLEK